MESADQAVGRFDDENVGGFDDAVGDVLGIKVLHRFGQLLAPLEPLLFARAILLQVYCYRFPLGSDIRNSISTTFGSESTFVQQLQNIGIA